VLPRPYLRTVSDERGLVSLSGVVAGTYSLAVGHAGYSRVSFLADTAAPAVIELVPYATIAGRVVRQLRAADGPLTLELLRRTKSETGESGWTLHSKTEADRLGRYRFAGLPEGEFTVRCSLSERLSAVEGEAPNDDGPATAYLGGTAGAAQATTISLRTGQEATAPDLPGERLRLHRLSGALVSSGSGKPLTDVVVNLCRTQTGEGGWVRPEVARETSATGKFAFGGLVEGTYTLMVQRGYELQRFDLNVPGRDVLGLTVTADDAFPVEIAARCEGCNLADLVDARFEFRRDVELDWAPANSQPGPAIKNTPAIIQPNGTASAALLPGRYRIRVVGSAGYTVAAVQQDGQSIFDGSTLTTKHAGRLTITVKKSTK